MASTCFHLSCRSGVMRVRLLSNTVLGMSSKRSRSVARREVCSSAVNRVLLWPTAHWSDGYHTYLEGRGNNPRTQVFDQKSAQCDLLGRLSDSLSWLTKSNIRCC